jgi:uncharacterized protein YycO
MSLTQLKENKSELLEKYLRRILKPGDMILYSSNGIFGKLIKFKTSSNSTHVAVYAGAGMIRESVEGEGVQKVALRLKNLYKVRRPKQPYDNLKAEAWFKTVDGQKYDYIGLFWSFYARKWGRENKKMWCSEYFTRDARMGGIEPFTPNADADQIHPGHCELSAAYDDFFIMTKELSDELEN